MLNFPMQQLRARRVATEKAAEAAGAATAAREAGAEAGAEAVAEDAPIPAAETAACSCEVKYTSLVSRCSSSNLAENGRSSRVPFSDAVGWCS